MKDFTQVYFSNGIKFFKEGFMKKWNLKDYTDPNKPSIFLGLYGPQDCQIVKDHKSYEIVSLTGGDMVPQNLNSAQHIICLLYTSPSPRDRQKSRMPSSA